MRGKRTATGGRAIQLSTLTGPESIVPAMIDDCPMTEDCPGYDRDLGVCLLRPGDCEFSPADREAVLIVEMPEASKPDASAEAVSR